MILKVENIPISKTSYPFASAEKYCRLSEKDYEETEYYMHGTANVYQTVDEKDTIDIAFANAPYVNRFILRAPKNPSDCSGNVVVEIINPTSFMEIDRMWILGHKEFIRNGDIYIGITSKPNTIRKMTEFDTKRYSPLSWKNPRPKNLVTYEFEESLKKKKILPDIDFSYETGLFWDMLTDLAWFIRSNDKANPLLQYPRNYLYLTGWSQSACYLFRYLNSFAYRTEVAREKAVFDGYLAGGGIRSLITPVNQYEVLREYGHKLSRVEKALQPLIAVQTESENGRYDGWRRMQPDSDHPDFKYRLYEVTGASHDTMYSYVDYYQKDPDLIRINHLPEYIGRHDEGNDYPSQFLFAAAFRNLFHWVRTGAAPNHCERIQVDTEGENRKDAFGNTVGGLRTCLLNYPTGRYFNTSNIEPGMSLLDPNSDKDGLFGYQEAFSAPMLKELYGTIENYRALVIQDTQEQISKGFLCKEDAEEFIDLALELADKRGLCR